MFHLKPSQTLIYTHFIGNWSYNTCKVLKPCSKYNNFLIKSVQHAYHSYQEECVHNQNPLKHQIRDQLQVHMTMSHWVHPSNRRPVGKKKRRRYNSGIERFRRIKVTWQECLIQYLTFIALSSIYYLMVTLSVTS